MEEKPKQSIWRIHLSTAIVMMIVTGMFMCANLYSKSSVWVNSLGQMRIFRLNNYGWPFTAIRSCEYLAGNATLVPGSESFSVKFPDPLPPRESIVYYYDTFEIMADICIAVLTLCTITGLLEYLFRGIARE